MDESLRMALTVSKYYKSVEEYKPSGLDITTITMIAKNLIDPLSLKDFKDAITDKHFEIPNGPTWTYRPPKKNKKKQSNKDFYNSISIGYRDTTTKSMKVFPNGSMQLTGVTDVKSGKHIFKQAVKVIKAAMGIDDTNVTYDDIYVAMINTNFALGFTLDLDEVMDVLNEENYVSTYTPDTYSAVIASLKTIIDDRVVKVSIFNSGSITVTGLKNSTLKEVTAAYLVINRLMRTNFEKVYNPHCQVTVKEKDPIKFNKILRKAEDIGAKSWEDI